MTESLLIAIVLYCAHVPSDEVACRKRIKKCVTADSSELNQLKKTCKRADTKCAVGVIPDYMPKDLDEQMECFK